MRALIAILLVALAAGCAGEPPKVDAAKPAECRALRVGPPVREGSLAVYPVLGGPGAAVPANALTLEEALARGLVTLRETGVVERLEVDNLADVPILIVGGEVLRGGQQDRVVAEDVLVAARAKGVAVDAFCVEHGRWSLRPGTPAGVFTSSSSLADPKLRALATVEKSQIGVWAEVSEKQRDLERALLASRNPTQSYALLASESGVAARTDAVVAALEQGLARAAVEGAPIVGFVVAIDGRLVAADVFGAPTLAAKLRPKLLRSYAVEALARRPGGEGPAAPSPMAPTAADAESFVRDGMAKGARLEHEGELMHAAMHAK